MRVTRLSVQSRDESSGSLFRIGIESGSASLRRVEAAELRFEDEIVPLPPVLDGAVIAVLHRLMAIGQPVVIEGTMSREALVNLEQWQALWARWRPGRLRPVALRPTEVLDTVPTVGEAVALFSGGADATFTALRHTLLLEPSRRASLRGVAMLHGFDLPIAERAAFDGLVERARPLIDRLGLRLHRIRTDLREAIDQGSYEDSHAAQLLGCLHFLSGRYGVGIIAGAEPIDRMPVIHGSTLATDPLLSGGRMRVLHDAVAWTRPQKLAAIASVPGALDGLKVCWEETANPGNCGVCEKCLRTRLSLRAVGVAEPRCFDRPLVLDRVRSVPLDAQKARTWRDILDLARANGQDGEWLEALAQRLRLFDWVHRPLAVPLQGLARLGRQPWLGRAAAEVPGLNTGIQRLRTATRRAVRLPV